MPDKPVANLVAVSPRRRKTSGGAALLESVFTLLPTIALICAFVDFGLVLFRWSTLQNAVREGCRYAVTFQRSGTLGQDASIAQVVQQYSMGLVTATDTPQHIFVKYYSPTNINTPITTGGNLPGNIVEVSVQNVSWSWIAPLSGSFGSSMPVFRDTTPFTVSVFSSDLLGAYPAGVSSVPR
jgi:Flp pilus assembly protein TadG